MNAVERVSEAILRGCTSVNEVYATCDGLTRRQVIRALQNAVKNEYVRVVVPGGVGGTCAVYGPGPVPLVIGSGAKAKAWVDSDLRGDLHWIGQVSSVWQLGAVA